MSKIKCLFSIDGISHTREIDLDEYHLTLEQFEEAGVKDRDREDFMYEIIADDIISRIEIIGYTKND